MERSRKLQTRGKGAQEKAKKKKREGAAAGADSPQASSSSGPAENESQSSPQPAPQNVPQVPNSAAKRSAANGGLMNTGAGTMNSNISSFGGNFNPSSCSEFKFSNQSGAPVPQPTDVPQQAAVPDQVSSSSKQEVHAAEVDLSAAAPNPPPAAAVPAPALFAPAIPGAAPPLAAVGIPGAAPPLGALSLPGAPIPPPLMKAVAPPPLLSGPKVLAYKSGRPVVVTNGPMRQLHWVPVPLDKIKDTCWQKDITDEKIDMDVDEFDYLFQRPQGVDMKKKTKGDEREELLTDPQRRINLKVSLSRFKLTPVNIRKAILSMDEQTLTPQMVEHLIELIGPMEKERPKMLDFNGEPGSLTNCQEFVYRLHDILNLADRLDVWKFKNEFHELADGIHTSISEMAQMCDGLRTSKHLTKILSIVLKFGNRLNASSSEKGGAYGFRISILPELAVLKSINKGTNLLEYLVKFLETKFPETMTFFDEEISRIDVCCGIKFARLASRLKEFRSSVDRTRDLAQVISSCAPVPIIQVSRSNSTEGSSDECESMSAKVHWESKLKELLEESEHVVSSLQTQLDELMDSARNLIKRFGDSPNDMSCDELLLVFKNLRNAFRRAQAALREAEKVEEKIKRKSVRKLAPKKRKSDRSDSALKRRKISLASESFHKIEPASASRALPAQVDLIEKPEPVPAKPVPAKGGLKSVLAAKRAFIADSDSDNEPLIRAPKKQRIEGAQYQLPEERPRMPVQLVHQIKRGAQLKPVDKIRKPEPVPAQDGWAFLEAKRELIAESGDDEEDDGQEWGD